MASTSGSGGAGSSEGGDGAEKKGKAVVVAGIKPARRPRPLFSPFMVPTSSTPTSQASRRLQRKLGCHHDVVCTLRMWKTRDGF